MKARAPALRTCPATCVSLGRLHRDPIPVLNVGLWLHWLGQCRFPEPPLYALSMCAVQSLQRLPRAARDVLRSKLEHEGCRPVRNTGPIERTVATRTVCAYRTVLYVLYCTVYAESSLVLVSGGPDLGDKSKAALGTHSVTALPCYANIRASPPAPRTLTTYGPQARRTGAALRGPLGPAGSSGGTR